ncbi:HAD family hydrolase [Lentzea sp. CA-135723]|uniref:HAD family hydrolase n=1 Tax=Lentzea sp. CA-135723 TaxID=3239950 RepID=UPI003D8D4E97
MKLAVLFDMNGVLVDDEALHEEAFRTALAQWRLPLDHGTYLRHFAGKTDLAGFTGYLREHAGTTATPDQLLTVKAQTYRLLADTNLQGYEVAVALVRTLRSTGHALALVTSSSRGEVELALKHLELNEAFDVIVTSEDVVEGKPSPEPFLLAADLLGRPPRECVVIEDSPSGVAAARAAGMRCIAVTSTHASAALRHADRVVTSLAEVQPSSLGHALTAG